MSKKILFVEAPITGATELYIEAFQRMNLDAVLLAQNPQRYLGVIDSQGRATFSAFKEIVHLDTEDDAAMLGFAKRRPHEFHGLVCVSDFCLIQAARLAAALELHFLSPEAVENFLNKDRAAERLRTCGIATPRILFSCPVPFDPAGLPGDIPFPVIVKPSRGSGSMGVMLCHNRDELLDGLRMAEPIARLNSCQLIAQEFVPGPLQSMECFIDRRGQLRILGHTSRELGLQPSFTEVSAAFPIPATEAWAVSMETAARTLVEDLSLRSAVLHIEYMLTDSGPVVVEVNARAPGSLVTTMISESYGQSLHELILRLALGEDIAWPTIAERAGAIRLIYARATGRLASRDHELAMRYPGVKQIVWHVPIGGQISSQGDFRSCVATVLTIGHNALDALMRASVAASAITFQMEQIHENS